MRTLSASVRHAEKSGARGVTLLVLRLAAALCSPTAHLH
eukprot:CAMPEP_0205933834 /NCGR_PEP_ID=MMETSP1325-20131115/34446_1 /ASSEMBLY_ACC=CAM_ASM_000708 /TAXON_ID=236786 /ORGANISM="Florenciella sp., Strain RCC1007" /LENGTH=38 /DNA_ID= /DNA_START= /DNA_END= /DNA_ORIENTATION=